VTESHTRQAGDRLSPDLVRRTIVLDRWQDVALAKRAKRNRRTLSAEARVILDRILGTDPDRDAG